MAHEARAESQRTWRMLRRIQCSTRLSWRRPPSRTPDNRQVQQPLAHRPNLDAGAFHWCSTPSPTSVSGHDRGLAPRMTHPGRKKGENEDDLLDNDRVPFGKPGKQKPGTPEGGRKVPRRDGLGGPRKRGDKKRARVERRRERQTVERGLPSADEGSGLVRAAALLPRQHPRVTSYAARRGRPAAPTGHAPRRKGPARRRPARRL